MNLKRGEVADLASDKIWTQELAGVLPCSAIRGKDAVAKKRDESGFSAVSEAPFFEIQGQNGLDVLRFDGLDEVSEEELHVRIVSIS